MSRTEWRPGSLTREAVLNVYSPRSRTFSVILLAALLGSSAAVFASFEAQNFVDRLTRLEAKGSNVVYFQSSSRKTAVTISRSSCELLAKRRGVARAGLLMDEGTRDIPELGTRVSIFTGSTTLFPELSSGDGVLGAGLVDTVQDRRISLGENDLRSVRVGVRQPEGIPTNNALVLPLEARSVSAPICIVVLDRYEEPRTAVSVLSPQLEAQGGALTARVQLAQTSAPLTDWTNRPGQYFTLVLGLMGGLCSSLLVWTRSSEIAAYRLSGTSRKSLGQLLTFEALLTAGTFGTSVALAAQVLQPELISLAEALFWALGGAATWMLTSAVGVIRSVSAKAASLARER